VAVGGRWQSPRHLVYVIKSYISNSLYARTYATELLYDARLGAPSAPPSLPVMDI